MELLGDVGHVESRPVRMEMVLVLVQDRCTVCAKRTIGQISFRLHPMVLLGTKLNWKVASVRLEIVLILTQDRCTVCAERTTSSEIVLDAPDRTHR